LESFKSPISPSEDGVATSKGSSTSASRSSLSSSSSYSSLSSFLASIANTRPLSYLVSTSIYGLFTSYKSAFNSPSGPSPFVSSLSGISSLNSCLGVNSGSS